ncbi:MAG: c-type cytochrome domain-containing protein [Fimbriimonas sp.]
MRTLTLLASGLVFVGGAAWQINLPAPLASHFDRLATAESLTVESTGRYVGETPTTLRLTMSKPNLFRLTTPDGFVVSDGTTITTYVAKDKTYSEAPATEEAVKAFAARPEVRPWSAFLVKKVKEDVLTAKAGSSRTVQGNQVSEVVVGMKGDTTGTVYVDAKQGVARGASLKTGAKEYLVLATKLEVGDKPLPATEYAFVAPAGAKKLEAVKPAATYASVQAIMNASCMPCHSAQNRRANIDLTNHAGIVAAVTPGNAAASRLVRSLHATGRDRMPKNAPPLPADQIATIEAWVNAGAKAE